MASRFLLSALSLFAGALVLSSCGGSGATQAPSPFQGTFAGNWSAVGGDSGTAQITVTPGGGVNGTETDTTINLPGTVAGTLQNNGILTGTITPQGHGPISESGQFQISQDGNTLSGTVTYNGVTYTYTLMRQVP
jgi:hypothetical protein